MLNTINKKLSILWHKYYALIIVLVLFISYGQILKMLPWQDDNALFFKLAHIKEPAGFLGNGVFGEGAYKYTAFFYYPIYLLFGYKEFYYFAFGFILYGISVFSVYKMTSSILNDDSGRIAGFLYACGFIGSDSFIRLFNSIITSLSVILVCLLIYAYWSFYKEKRIRWYFYSIIFFLLAAEFARARTHYLIVVPIIFEILFLSFKRPVLKSLLASLSRVLPFLPIFYRYVILEDYRSKEAGNFVLSLIHGGFYKIFGFLSTLANVFLPNWLIKVLSAEKSVGLSENFLSNSTFYFLILCISVLIFCIYIFLKFKKFRFLVVTFILFSLIWGIISSKIFVNPNLVANSDQIHMAYIGGVLMFLIVTGFFLIDKKYKLMYLFLVSGLLINMLSYSAYNPTQVYEKINRYLSHSFLYLVVLFGLIYHAANLKWKRTVFFILILWGLSNLFEGFLYQHDILINRTRPVRSFYKEFMTYVPYVNKGDVIYIDIQDEARGKFSDAFSVAQMPNTTAIAWRYGVDRDDFKLFENPSDLFGYLRGMDLSKIPNLRTFFYSKDGLFDTTKNFTNYFNSSKFVSLKLGVKNSTLTLNTSPNGTWVNKSEVELKDNLDIFSQTPLKVQVDIMAKPLNFKNQIYPIHYGFDTSPSPFSGNTDLANLAFKYKKFREHFLQSALEVSSTWQDRLGNNLIDLDPNTSWQADRLKWLKSDQTVVIKTPEMDVFDRFVFVNSFSDNSPIEFDMYYSNDGVNWSLLSTYKNSQRLKNSQTIVVDFEPKKFRYFKIKFDKTLNGDSPAISELWLVPKLFSKLNISETEKFLNNSFSNILSYKEYLYYLNMNGYVGRVDLLWENNKSFGLQGDARSYANVLFDGKWHSYTIPILPGGTLINKIKLSAVDFPGEIYASNFKILYSN